MLNTIPDQVLAEKFDTEPFVFTSGNGEQSRTYARSPLSRDRLIREGWVFAPRLELVVSSDPTPFEIIANTSIFALVLARVPNLLSLKEGEVGKFRPRNSRDLRRANLTREPKETNRLLHDFRMSRPLPRTVDLMKAHIDAWLAYFSTGFLSLYSDVEQAESKVFLERFKSVLESVSILDEDLELLLENVPSAEPIDGLDSWERELLAAGQVATFRFDTSTQQYLDALDQAGSSVRDSVNSAGNSNQIFWNSQEDRFEYYCDACVDHHDVTDDY